MKDLSHHILDIAENSVRAGARRILIRLAKDRAADRLRLEIADDGQGMDEEMRRRVLSPFTTSRTERPVGLGLSLLAQAARETGGECEVTSAPGKGTRVTATFVLGHIDRKPVGDLGETILTLAVGNPDLDIVVEVERDGASRRLDTGEIRASLDGAPLCSAAGLRTLRAHIAETMKHSHESTSKRANESTRGASRCLSQR